MPGDAEGLMRKRKHITSYGRLILARMEAKGMTLWDLAQEVERRTGMFCDEQYISNHLRGVPTPWRQTQAIREAVGLPGRRGQVYAKNPAVRR